MSKNVRQLIPLTDDNVDMGMAILMFSIMGSFLWAQAPPAGPNPPPTAQQAGEQMGAATGAAVAEGVQSGLQVTNSNDLSFYQNSLENYINSQQGQTTSVMMAEGLNSASSQYSSSCASAGPEDPTCYATGVLNTMAGQSLESSRSFTPVVNQAWASLCQFSTTSCEGAPPNPFRPSGAVEPSQIMMQITSTGEALRRRGYTIDYQLGLVRSPSGRTLYSNQTENLSQTLGSAMADQILKTVQKLEASIQGVFQRPSQVQIQKRLGLKPLSPGENQKTKWGHEESSNQRLKRDQQEIKKSIEEQLIGMSKFYQGQRIGIARDHIFQMIHRRYQMKRHNKFFLR